MSDIRDLESWTRPSDSSRMTQVSEATHIVALPRAFESRYGVPVIRRVETGIFTRRYFTHCLDCTFCHDACCAEGVDVDLVHVAEIERHATGLEQLTGIPRQKWFHARLTKDPEVPGGGYRRTRVKNGRCVFLNRSGRGCLIHSYCLREGIDYHELKSMTDCLFPLTYSDDTLSTAYDVDDGSLACLNTGPTLYRGVRDEVAYYFGKECVAELDRIEGRLDA